MATIEGNTKCITNNRSQYDVIYCDLPKAFDSVDHTILLHKFSNIGLSPRYIKWLESYLTDVVVIIKLGYIICSVVSVTIGMPQGSLLDTLLLNTLLNILLNT